MNLGIIIPILLQIIGISKRVLYVTGDSTLKRMLKKIGGKMAVARGVFVAEVTVG
jgi:hypothetical protein